MKKNNDQDETKTSDTDKLRVRGNANKVYQNIKDSTITDESVTLSHSSSKDNTTGNKIKRSKAIMWIASVSIIAVIGWFVVQPLEWIKNKLTQDNKIAMIQIHSGSGDIIGRDKVIHQHLYGSIDYHKLVEDIAYNKKILTSISENDYEGRLSVSEKISQLNGQLESFKEDVFRLYETFTKIPINTERLKQAKKLFDEGKFREADVILKTEEMNIELEAADRLQNEGENKINEAHQIRDRVANEFLIKAQLWTTFYDEPDWFEKANQYYEQAVNASRNVNILFEYALFLQKHNQFNQAQPLYEEALILYRNLAEANPAAYLPDVATTLNNLANLHSSKNDFAEAQDKYQEALKIRRKLAEANPATYMPYVATTLNNLANLHSSKNEFDEAQDKYQEALKIRRKLAEANPATYMPDVATTLNNLANLLSYKNEFTEAQEKYEEALKIRRKLAEANPTTYLPTVATTLNNLAILHSDKNEFADAQDKYQEALKIRRKLAEANPATYLPNMAIILNNLANLLNK